LRLVAFSSSDPAFQISPFFQNFFHRELRTIDLRLAHFFSYQDCTLSSVIDQKMNVQISDDSDKTSSLGTYSSARSSIPPCVVFPLPVSPETSTTWLRLIVSII
jgi:hypothetical protein